MEVKNLKSLVLKHFYFLVEEYGFNYNASSYRYVKDNLEIEVEHKNGELNVLFISKKEIKSLTIVMSELLKKEFSYPKHFSTWVLSMGDVDSRLSYDAKIIKAYAEDIL